MANLVGVDLLREFFHVVILTGRVKGKPPVSTMLIADPERGKTSIVLEKNSDSVIILTDVTGRGLDFLCQMAPKTTHIVINDMGIVMAHSRSTKDFFFSKLLAVLEEGLRTSATPAGIETMREGQGRKGLVGCITSSQACDNRSWWFRRGIARRMVPFHFEYTCDLILKVKEMIEKDRGATFASTETMVIPEISIDVKCTEENAHKIREISDLRAAKLGELGISLLKNYLNLARAHAIKRTWKNPSVNEEDIFFIRRIDPYVSWTEKALL